MTDIQSSSGAGEVFLLSHCAKSQRPVDQRHRNLTLEKIDLRLRTVAAFLSHTTAFAAIRAGVPCHTVKRLVSVSLSLVC